MTRTILSITIFFLMVSCNTKHKETSTSVTNQTDVFSFSVIDSLKKYSNQDSISIPFKAKGTSMTEDTTSKVDEEGNNDLIETIDTIDALFFMGKANNVNFGLTLKGAKLNFYQKIKDIWTLTDSLEFFGPPVIINRMEINGDGYQDIRIANAYNESGDLLTCVFLFDFKTKTFKHNYSYGQNNVEYDNENKFVRSWLYGTKGQSAIKWKSSVQGEKLFVDSTIAYSLINGKSGKLAKLELYKNGNSASNPPIKIIEGDADSLWTIFSKTFWNSSGKMQKKNGDNK